MPVKSRPRCYQSEVRTAAADETRARIVAAARTLLVGGKGLPQFSIEGVARQAEVTRLTVYNQFESRRGLLEAVFNDLGSRGGMFQLQAVMAAEDIDTALRMLVSLFCGFWTMHGPVVSKLIALARLDEEIADSLRRRAE